MVKPTHTPLRNIRVPDPVWQAARARAESEGKTISKVINDYLIKYGRSRKPSTRGRFST